MSFECTTTPTYWFPADVSSEQVPSLESLLLDSIIHEKFDDLPPELLPQAQAIENVSPPEPVIEAEVIDLSLVEILSSTDGSQGGGAENIRQYSVKGGVIYVYPIQISWKSES